jgi:eukaryotic-like serine/threonine-protein kinase
MLQAGQRLDEYQVIRAFASGGMGEIYLAEEMAVSRQVALKVIRLEAVKYPNSEEARKVMQLFRREATAIARLNHPSILPLFKFGETTSNGESLVYIVMPYCQEKSLADWMDGHGKTIFSPQEANVILKQAAEALQYAHDQRIIHLDVKPPNFLVRYPTNDASQLKLQLTDFGIAKFTATTGMSQSVRGTLTYMAPEQWEGQPVFATDQYALAVMLYRLLTGQLPFTAMGFEQLWHQHRYTQPQSPSTINSSISPSIDAVILRALAKKPNDRFHSVEAFATAYQQALQIRQTEYAAIRKTLSLTPNEASGGTTRTLTLPSGEQLPITIPSGVAQSQLITIPRLNAPTIILRHGSNALDSFI